MKTRHLVKAVILIAAAIPIALNWAVLWSPAYKHTTFPLVFTWLVVLILFGEGEPPVYEHPPLS